MTNWDEVALRIARECFKTISPADSQVVEYARRLRSKFEKGLEPIAWINVEKRCLEWDALGPVWSTGEAGSYKRIPLYAAAPQSVNAEAKDAEQWRKWSKIVCGLPEHNFPHQHTFSYMREEMRAAIDAAIEGGRK